MIFHAGDWRCVELAPEDAPRLQRFYEVNPEYFQVVHGEPPRDGEAMKTFTSLPPAGWRYDRKWVLAFEDRGGQMLAMADVISGLFVPRVWHLGLFVISKSLYGTGAARTLCAGIESWMRAGGARWSRLGVAAGNVRAERFWEKTGYVELRRREGVMLGRRTHSIRVMMKPLDGGTREEYLALVERDRPD